MEEWPQQVHKGSEGYDLSTFYVALDIEADDPVEDQMLGPVASRAWVIFVQIGQDWKLHQQVEDG